MIVKTDGSLAAVTWTPSSGREADRTPVMPSYISRASFSTVGLVATLAVTVPPSRTWMELVATSTAHDAFRLTALAFWNIHQSDLFRC